MITIVEAGTIANVWNHTKYANKKRQEESPVLKALIGRTLGLIRIAKVEQLHETNSQIK